MKKPPVIIAINGIRTKQIYSAWPRRFDWWLDANLDEIAVAERYEYECSALFRFKGQRARVDELIEIVNGYKNNDQDIILVGHSNGCDIIQRILNMGIHVREVHCFAPAAFEADFSRAIERKACKRIFIYGSTNDRALRLARDTQFLTRTLSFLLRPFGVPQLGYGWLGLNAAAFAAQHPDIVTDCSNNRFDHSTWFEEQYFDSTMLLFEANYTSKQGLAPVSPPPILVPPTPTTDMKTTLLSLLALCLVSCANGPLTKQQAAADALSVAAAAANGFLAGGKAGALLGLTTQEVANLSALAAKAKVTANATSPAPAPVPAAPPVK